MDRRITKQVRVGDVTIGSTQTIAIQTMWSSALSEYRDEQSFQELLTKLRSYATM